ncbi:MAG: HTTM domain-containing protein [Flavobacteriaceae bacterium]
MLTGTKTYTDAASLTFYRIGFGLLMAWSMIRFMLKGWVDSVYIEPLFHFKYFGFSWIPELGLWTYALFILAAISALLMATGRWYKIAATLFFLCFTYIELLEKTTYLNHYYFISVLSFILIFLPADRKGWVPTWSVNALKILISIVYFYAGLAKLNSDWLIEAQPLGLWLRSKYDLAPILQERWVHYLMSYGGAIYDLIIPFLLWNKKTQKYALVLVVIFHILTRILFPIGMFPYIMIFSSLIFLPAQWHRKILRLGANTWPLPKPTPRKTWGYYMVIALLLIQVLLPWRYLAYPGELFWTEEGFRFSWRVMLMEKSGYTSFKVVHEGGSFMVNNEDFLTSYQIKQMSFQPDMILEYAHFLGDHYSEHGFKKVRVFTESYVALNGRRSQQFIDPNVDLYKETETFKPKTWILPFKDKIYGL